MKDLDTMTNNIRLQVYLSKCGVDSRRGCETIIKNGRVSVNGKIVTKMGTKVSPEDIIELDSRKINIVNKYIYVALNKPKGYLCTNYDKLKRPIAIDLLKGAVNTRLFHVGRLDFNSGGLIFYTNDGDFAEIVSHPSYKIEKEYYIETSRIIPEDLLISYKKGLIIDNVKYSLLSYKILSEKKAILTILEGKNREIRKVFNYSNIFLKKIIRKRIGIVKLNELLPGQFRFLSKKEVNWFMNVKKNNN